MDPTQWPLDVDVAEDDEGGAGQPALPGRQFTVYGDFCWSGDKPRAESYFIPAGTKPSPPASEQPRPRGGQEGDAAAAGRAHARHGHAPRATGT